MDTIQIDTNAEVSVATKIEAVDTYTAKEVETKTIITETVIDLESLAKDIEATTQEIANTQAYKIEEVANRNSDIARFSQIQDDKIALLQTKLTQLQSKVTELKSKGIQEKPEPVIPIPAEELPVDVI